MENAGPFISAADLLNALNKPDHSIRLYDCRFDLSDANAGLLQYDQGHITGAYFLDLEADLSGPPGIHGGRHPLPRQMEIQDRLNSTGLSIIDTIVVYDDKQLSYAARAWWLLRFLGHPNVLVLDGGYQAWLQAGGKIDKREPEPLMGNFRCQPQENWIIDHSIAEQISRDPDGDQILIDARESRRFKGEIEPIDPVAGSIPNAINKPWQEVLDQDGKVKPIEFHQQRWQELDQQQILISYCGSGVTACVNLLSMHLAGKTNVRLYPGSWSDWCSHL